MSENIKTPIEFAQIQAQTRRQFLGWGMGGLGALYMNDAMAASGHTLDLARNPSTPLSVLPPQIKAKVKRVIYLHMGGAPSQLELFDHKPMLARFHGKPAPEAFLKGKRFAFISGIPKLLGPMFPFHQAGKSGACRTWKNPSTICASSSRCAPTSSTMRRRSFWCIPAIRALAMPRWVPG